MCSQNVTVLQVLFSNLTFAATARTLSENRLKVRPLYQNSQRMFGPEKLVRCPTIFGFDVNLGSLRNRFRAILKTTQKILVCSMNISIVIYRLDLKHSS